jgi:hypothetical protein
VGAVQHDALAVEQLQNACQLSMPLSRSHQPVTEKTPDIEVEANYGSKVKSWISGKRPPSRRFITFWRIPVALPQPPAQRPRLQLTHNVT